MLNVAAACYQNRRYSVGGTAASVGAHALLLALFLGWLGFSADEPKGMLPLAFVLMPEFISWKVPRRKRRKVSDR